MPANAIRGTEILRLTLLCLTLVGGLTACELTNQPREQAPPAPAAEPRDEQASLPTTTAVPEPKPKVPAQPPPPRPSMEPQVLIGLGEDEITRLIGQPRQVRNDPPAMVWSYGVSDCKMDLFFYLDLKSQDFRALAYNFEANTTSDDAKKACLARIQEANRDRRR